MGWRLGFFLNQGYDASAKAWVLALCVGHAHNIHAGREQRHYEVALVPDTYLRQEKKGRKEKKGKEKEGKEGKRVRKAFNMRLGLRVRRGCM